MMPAIQTTSGYKLNSLLDGLTNYPVPPQLEVTGLNNDSRNITPGDLFLACKGQHTDGILFIEDAVRAGAAAVLVETGEETACAELPVIPVTDLRIKTGIIASRFFGNPSTGIEVVGVTGTNGKTTVSFAAAAVLNAVAKGSCGLIGTLGYGQDGRLSEVVNTTPDAIRLQQILFEMKSKSVRTVVMEVSSHGLDQGRTSGIEFHSAVFTNLTEEHLDYHGDMAAYAAAKKQLFLAPGLKHAVINVDDPYGMQLAGEIGGRLQVITYGLSESAGISHGTGTEFISGAIIKSSLDGLSLDVRSPWGEGRVDISAGGKFNAYNLLASLAVVHLLGVPFERALAELPGVFPIPGRIETFHGDHFTVVVDYAHTPDALENVLRSLREICTGRLVCVFGCGGDRDRGKRPRMGEIAGRYADRIILTNDNPRSEQPESIINDILAGISRRENVTVQSDRAQAITSAIGEALPDDVILIAGKGHETWQEIGRHRYPFNDRQLVRTLLGGGG